MVQVKRCEPTGIQSPFRFGSRMWIEEASTIPIGRWQMHHDDLRCMAGPRRVTGPSRPRGDAWAVAGRRLDGPQSHTPYRW